MVQSVDIDAQFRPESPNAARWDYLLQVGTKRRSTTLAVEVHSAADDEVSAVIQKKQWTGAHLREHTDVRVARWIWAASGRVTITKNSKYARRLATAGIEFPTRVVRC